MKREKMTVIKFLILKVDFLCFFHGVLLARLLALRASVATLSSSKAARRAVRGRGSCCHVLLGDSRNRRSRHGDRSCGCICPRTGSDGRGVLCPDRRRRGWPAASVGNPCSSRSPCLCCPPTQELLTFLAFY
jgi:hypothetical protein